MSVETYGLGTDQVVLDKLAPLPEIRASAPSVIEHCFGLDFLPSRTGLGEIKPHQTPAESVPQAFARLYAKSLMPSEKPQVTIIPVVGSVTPTPQAGDETYVYYNPGIDKKEQRVRPALVRRDKRGAHSQVVQATYDGEKMTLVEGSRVLDNCEDPYLYRDQSGVLHAGMVKVLNDLNSDSQTPSKTRIQFVVYRLTNGLKDLNNPDIQPIMTLDHTKDFRPIPLANGNSLNMLRPQAGQLREREGQERTGIHNVVDSETDRMFQELDQIDEAIFGRGKMGWVITGVGEQMSQAAFDQYITFCRKMGFINKDRLDQMGGFIFNGNNEYQRLAFEKLIGEKPLFRQAVLRFDQTVGDDHAGANGGEEETVLVNGQVQTVVRVDMHIASRIRDAQGNIVKFGPDEARRYIGGRFYIDPETGDSTQVEPTTIRELVPSKDARNESLFSVVFSVGRIGEDEVYAFGDVGMAKQPAIKEPFLRVEDVTQPTQVLPDQRAAA